MIFNGRFGIGVHADNGVVFRISRKIQTDAVGIGADTIICFGAFRTYFFVNSLAVVISTWAFAGHHAHAGVVTVYFDIAVIGDGALFNSSHCGRAETGIEQGIGGINIRTAVLRIQNGIHILGIIQSFFAQIDTFYFFDIIVAEAQKFGIFGVSGSFLQSLALGGNIGTQTEIIFLIVRVNRSISAATVAVVFFAAVFMF